MIYHFNFTIFYDCNLFFLHLGLLSSLGLLASQVGLRSSNVPQLYTRCVHLFQSLFTFGGPGDTLLGSSRPSAQRYLFSFRNKQNKNQFRLIRFSFSPFSPRPTPRAANSVSFHRSFDSLAAAALPTLPAHSLFHIYTSLIWIFNWILYSRLLLAHRNHFIWAVKHLYCCRCRLQTSASRRTSELYGRLFPFLLLPATIKRVTAFT